MKLRFCILMCLLLSGCMLQPVKTDLPHRYLLKGASTKRYANIPTNLTLLVSQMNANPGYQSEDLIYVNNPYQLNSFGKSVWVAPPTQLLLPVLVESLRNSNYFYAVMTAPFVGITDIRLDSQLLSLQQEFFPKRSQVRMSLQVTLIDNSDNHILASRKFSDDVASASNDPMGGVIAANKATEHLMQQITAFVITTCKNREHSSALG